MKALPSNIDKYSRSGCIPVSATCVTWDGPNISCIDLCKGDTVDVVIYELAKILCDITENVLDVSTLDFDCLLENGECQPKTILETLQLIISEICLPPEPVPPTPFPMPIADLPECLWYTEGGDEITSLPLDEYVYFLAQKICDILVSIANLTSLFNTLFNQVQLIQTFVDNGGGGSGTPPIINITTQCLSGSAPGQVLPIETAFFNMEQALCSYLAILGTLTQWQEMFNNICIDSVTVLPCGEGTYGDIAGWITNPTTAAQSMNNLWLVVCQLNDCLSTEPTLPCVVIPPVSVTIASISMTGPYITWVAPVTIGSEVPLGYKLEIFDLALTIPPLFSVILGPTPLSYTVPAVSLVAGTEYIVRLQAIYDCGTSGYVQTTGVLVETVYTAKIYYGVTETKGPTVNCINPLGPVTPYTPDIKTIRVDLRDVLGNPLINLGTTINVIVRIEHNDCSASLVYTDITIQILSGQTFGTYVYTASEMIYCAGEGCIPSTKNLACYVEVELAGGASLPSTIALDSSLTSLGLC